MTAVVMTSSVFATTKLRGRFGPRPLVTFGMLLGAAGMMLLTRLDVDANYWTDILPSLYMLGIGIGLIFSSSMNNATLGVRPEDAGVASATVSASQQVGGSIGTALLSTLATTAATNFAAGGVPGPQLFAQAAVHGYTTAFAWAGGLLVLGAVLALALFERNAPVVAMSAEPVMAH
jgi:hypothetical protein